MYTLVAEMNAETEGKDNNEALTERRDPEMNSCLQSVFTALDGTWCLHTEFKAVVQDFL